MHLNGKSVKMSFVGKNLQEMDRLMILKKFGPQGSVCPHPGAIYMYITVIFKDLLL